jgi:MFS family permease
MVMKKELKVLLWASGFMMLAGGLFGPIYAVFVEEIGGDVLTAGGAYSAFALSAGVLIFFLSKWEDHHKHAEKLVIAGYVLALMGTLGYLFVKTPMHLFVVQIIFGIGEAIGTPAYDGIYSRNLDKGKYISEWGAWESMAWIIQGISAAVGGLIAAVFGFQVLFGIMAGLSLTGLLISIRMLRVHHGRK